MRPITLIFALLPFLPVQVPAQGGSEEQAVAAVINQLFTGMRGADTVAVRAAFHPHARLQTATYDQEGRFVLQSSDLDDFISRIGQLPAGALDERLWRATVRVDGPLAAAWTEYSFFLRGNLSHCGVNAFQLVQTTDGWKILQVTDTRERAGCRTSGAARTDSLHALVDAWHQAAARADADAFYGAMAPEAIYLGTDAGERWLRDELREWASFAFERESAWDFKPRQRRLYTSDDGLYAWWEELLDTWMGDCRGSGVATWRDGRWQILHYHLSVTVPNDKMDGFIDLVKE